ncbi:hypothetical protein QNE77_001949 [Vibrio alginolyticus]|nr:hypothetical protein [Vibrio alginolyticus]
MTDSNNFFYLTEWFKKNIDWLNEILIGGETDSALINGVEKPSIDKRFAERFSALQAMVQGRKTFATKAEMDADLNYKENTLAEVWNDPIAEQNGLYGKLGSEGQGSWLQSDYDVSKVALAIANSATKSTEQLGGLEAGSVEFKKGGIPGENITASSANTTWIEKDPVSAPSIVQEVNIYVINSNTSVSLKVFERTGSTFSLINEVSLGTFNAGLHKIETFIPVKKGDYLGWYSYNGLSVSVGYTGQGYYTASGDVAIVNDDTPSAQNARVAIEWVGKITQSSINSDEIMQLSDRLSSSENLLYQAPITLGGIPSTPDGNSSANYTWVEKEAVEQDFFVETVTVLVTNSDTHLVFKTFNRVGDTFTASCEKDFGLLPIGKHTLYVGKNITKGEYLGWYSNNGLALQTNYIDQGYFFAQGNQDIFESSIPSSTTVRIAIEWNCRTTITNDLTNLKEQLFNTVRFKGTENLNSTGVPITSPGNWILGLPSTKDTELTLFRCDGVLSPCTFSIRVYSRDGDIWTVKREQVVDVSVGYNEIPLSLSLLPGEYVGVQAPRDVWNYDKDGLGEAVRYPVYFGSFVDLGDSFTSINSSLFGFWWDFHILDSVVQDHEKRISHLESGKQGLPFSYNLILGAGQSLMEGSYTNGLDLQQPITLVQEYDTLGFQGRIDNGVLAPATVATTQVGTRGEWSGLGCAGRLKQLLSIQQNINPYSPGNTVVISNEGWNGRRLDQIDKGGDTGMFEMGISKASKIQSIVDNKDAGVLAVIFMQGETEGVDGGPFDEWKQRLHTMANDYNEDIKKATGQDFGVNLYSYQLSTYRKMSLTQLEAHEEYQNITIVSPMYQFAYYDKNHIGAQGERLIGAYFAEAIHHTVVRGVPFEPLKPIALRVLGNTVTMTFNRGGLQFNTDMLPLQTNYGFAVKDGLTEKSINSVDISNTNEVRIRLSEPPQPGWVVEYGTPVVGLGSRIGVAGNLCDSAGEGRLFDDIPLHNWCVIFDYEI